MNATETDYMVYEEFDSDAFELVEPSADEPDLDESDLYETEWDFAAATRPHFKDASEFGRACRLLAIPAKRRNRYAEI